MVNIYTMNKVCFSLFSESVLAVAAATDTSVMWWVFHLLLLLLLLVLGTDCRSGDYRTTPPPPPPPPSPMLMSFILLFVTEVGSPVSWLQHALWLLDVFKGEGLPGCEEEEDEVE